jgi:hypothetical protein
VSAEGRMCAGESHGALKTYPKRVGAGTHLAMRCRAGDGVYREMVCSCDAVTLVVDVYAPEVRAM